MFPPAVHRHHGAREGRGLERHHGTLTEFVLWFLSCSLVDACREAYKTCIRIAPGSWVDIVFLIFLII